MFKDKRAAAHKHTHMLASNMMTGRQRHVMIRVGGESSSQPFEGKRGKSALWIPSSQKWPAALWCGTMAPLDFHVIEHHVLRELNLVPGWKLKEVENKDGRRQGAPKMKPKHLKGLASFLWQREEAVVMMAAIFVPSADRGSGCAMAPPAGRGIASCYLLSSSSWRKLWSWWMLVDNLRGAAGEEKELREGSSVHP